MKLSQNTAVFIIFFGYSLFEAIKSGKWLLVLLFLVLGAMSVKADNPRKK